MDKAIKEAEAIGRLAGKKAHMYKWVGIFLSVSTIMMGFIIMILGEMSSISDVRYRQITAVMGGCISFFRAIGHYLDVANRMVQLKKIQQEMRRVVRTVSDADARNLATPIRQQVLEDAEKKIENSELEVFGIPKIEDVAKDLENHIARTK
jgi:hypothetical protein